MRRQRLRPLAAFVLTSCTFASRQNDPPASATSLTGAVGESSGGASDDDDDGEGDDSGAASGGLKLDVAADTDSTPCAEGGCDDACAVPPHQACDGDSDDLLQAIGLDCPGELAIEGTVEAAAVAQGVRSGFGSTSTWAPREGTRMAVLGTGVVADLDLETPSGDQAIAPTHCNDDVGPQWDKGPSLPAPLQPKDVAGDCASAPALVGSGDCSNSIQKQYEQGVSANDYAELRLSAQVPAGSTSFSYDLAFFSVEYPFYYFSEFNDMYVGWLESESWTGNISFDAFDNPISLNASFLDYRDDDGSAPELAGTCMRGHAGTKWLTTTAPVVPGEQVTIVFAIFDLSDSILDSFVFLDNFQWGCEGGDHPTTEPVG
ncbi:MAG: choice-of-anchor L domain-containing protein [Nannocystaceae bacterium]|nr:choice-of-anchor L domain-containing protein [Nannocystaceae bacterium]